MHLDCFFNCEFPEIVFLCKEQAALNYILGKELIKIISIVFTRD